MKQIMFSTVFPAYHPYKGKPTRFVEKIWAGLTEDGCTKVPPYYDYPDFNNTIYNSCRPKLHTVRAGQRWKPGDQFVGKVWSGRPYRSKTITVTPVLTVERVWYLSLMFLSGVPRVTLGNKEMVFGNFIDDQLAVNDGLTYKEFVAWFKTPQTIKTGFAGQIICWNKKVNYGRE